MPDPAAGRGEVPGPLTGATRGDALRSLGQSLRTAGVATPDLDARILLTDLLGLTFAAVLAAPDVRLEAHEASRLRAATRRRVAGEPVARILGLREFWGLPFRLSPATLEPRPDTETLVSVALAAARRRTGPIRILDLGTGTGCILTALLTELPDAWGLGVDLSANAAAVARDNARLNGVADRSGFIAGHWASAVGGTFDLVVSNPPYILKGAIADLAADVRDYDPHLALDGGDDGLAAYRALAKQVPPKLAPGGVLALEVGQGQSADVAALLAAAGLADIEITPDLSGVERVVTATR